jgi:holo-[acyl-carrier protein] synthase
VIFGTGIDIVAISRFERFVVENNTALFRRLFTVREMEYCLARKRCAQHYALRFAAKEAFLKALGTGLRDGLSWLDIEVVHDDLGKPLLKLSGEAERHFAEKKLAGCFLSLSHDGNCAVASVVLETV